MFRPETVLAALAALCLAPAAAQAQSSLGFNLAEASAVARSGDGGRGDLRLTGDWRVGPAQGVQLDLTLADHTGGYLGQIDGHLYLSLADDAKYGVFVSLADVSNREATVAMAGVEGMWRLGDRVTVQGKAALGFARPHDMDFVAVHGRADVAVGPHTSLFGDIGWASVDEAWLSATVTQARLGVTHAPGGGPVELYVALASDRLSGRDAAPSEMRVEVGLTARLGASGNARRSVGERSFAGWQPFDPLIRRGRF
jgi:hypothetical protein